MSSLIPNADVTLASQQSGEDQVQHCELDLSDLSVTSGDVESNSIASLLARENINILRYIGRVHAEFRDSHFSNPEVIKDGIQIIRRLCQTSETPPIDEHTWDNLMMDDLVLAILPPSRTNDEHTLFVCSVVPSLLNPPTKVEEIAIKQDAIGELFYDQHAFDAVDAFLQHPAVKNILHVITPRDQISDLYQWHRTSRDIVMNLCAEVDRLPEFQTGLLRNLVAVLKDVGSTEIARHYAHGTTKTESGLKPSCDDPGSSWWQRFNLDHLFESHGLIDKALQGAFLTASAFHGSSAVGSALCLIAFLEFRHLRMQNRDIQTVLEPLLKMSHDQLAPALSAISHLSEIFAVSRFLKNSKLPCTPVNLDQTGEMSFVASDMGSPLHTGQSQFVLNTASIKDNTIQIIEGANNGGKSTFLTSIGQNITLTQAYGWAIAEEARLSPTTRLRYVIPRQGELDEHLGLFGLSLKQLSKEFDLQLGGDVFMLIDELGVGTNERAVAPHVVNILQTLQRFGVRVMAVTHNPLIITQLGTNGVNVLRAEARWEEHQDGTEEVKTTFRILPASDSNAVTPEEYVASVVRSAGVSKKHLDEFERMWRDAHPRVS